MKRLLITFVLIFVVLSSVGCTCSNQIQTADYLRIHIRANSNLDVDQNIKYKVKDSVVTALTPLLDGVQTKAQAMKIVQDNLSYLEAVADKSLQAQGVTYRSRARLCQEDFPTRHYGELTLESGVYDALIIELGSGSGDNWWCVVFPPLCFVGQKDGKDIKYKSLVVEICEKIKRWLK